MQYFDNFTEKETEKYFYIRPGEFNKFSDKSVLEHALGALLYFPATKTGLVNFLRTNKNLKSIVFCLEDAIGDNNLAEAQKNLYSQLVDIKNLYGPKKYKLLPLMFIRVRSPQHLHEIIYQYRDILEILTGFIFPKFDTKVAKPYYDIFESAKKLCPSPLYSCPILEGPDVIEKEKRISSLNYIKNILDHYKDEILNIRIGATDLLGLYRLRRKINYSIYDISVLKDFIGDVVNFFGRKNDPYVISGGVWEFLENSKNTDCDCFNKNYNGLSQQKLIEETQLDLLNGLWGKTAIHPTQLLPIQLNYITSYEDYIDALDIISDESYNKGTTNSKFLNKMNEYKPHKNWAQKIIARSKVYGVFNENIDYESVINKKTN